MKMLPTLEHAKTRVTELKAELTKHDRETCREFAGYSADQIVGRTEIRKQIADSLAAAERMVAKVMRAQEKRV